MKRTADEAGAVEAEEAPPAKRVPSGASAGAGYYESASSHVGDDHCSFYAPMERRAVDNLSYAAFLREYVLTGKPVILTGLGEWTLPYLAGLVSEQETHLVKVYENGRNWREEMSVKMVIELMHLRRQRPLPDSRRYYLTDWEFGRETPQLYGDYTVPTFFDHNMTPDMGVPFHQLKWLFIGEEGTGSPTHIDFIQSSAWLYLLEGRKHWRSVHRSQGTLCKNVVGGEIALVDLFHSNTNTFPAFAQVTMGWEGVQEAGELVFNPTGLVHGVRNLEFCVALTHNYLDLSNAADAYRDFTKPLFENADALKLAEAVKQALAKSTAATGEDNTDAGHLLRENLRAKLSVLRDDVVAAQQAQLRAMDEIIESL